MDIGLEDLGQAGYRQPHMHSSSMVMKYLLESIWLTICCSVGEIALSSPKI